MSVTTPVQRGHVAGVMVPGSLLSTVTSLQSLSLLSGVSLILLGLICFIVSPQLEAALVRLVQTWTALVSGETGQHVPLSTQYSLPRSSLGILTLYL